MGLILLPQNAPQTRHLGHALIGERTPRKLGNSSFFDQALHRDDREGDWRLFSDKEYNRNILTQDLVVACVRTSSHISGRSIGGDRDFSKRMSDTTGGIHHRTPSTHPLQWREAPESSSSSLSYYVRPIPTHLTLELLPCESRQSARTIAYRPETL